jgi:hypothetical protein
MCQRVLTLRVGLDCAELGLSKSVSFAVVPRILVSLNTPYAYPTVSVKHGTQAKELS